MTKIHTHKVSRCQLDFSLVHRLQNIETGLKKEDTPRGVGLGPLAALGPENEECIPVLGVT